MAVTPRFQAQYRVRFDEADASGQLRPSGFLRFAQDIAWQHSEAAGFDRAWYADRALHWLVRDVDLRVLGPVVFGQRLDVSTEVVGWRHIWARRHAEVRDVPHGSHSDALLATIATDWVLLGADARPARLPSEIAVLLASGSTFVRRRLDLGPPPASASSIAWRVRDSDVDPMGHLNNASYLDLIDEAISALGLTGPARAKRYRISYHLPAVARVDVAAVCWRTVDGAIACRIHDPAGRELTSVMVDLATP